MKLRKVLYSGYISARIQPDGRDAQDKVQVASMWGEAELPCPHMAKQMVLAASRNVPQTSFPDLRAMSNGSLKPSWRVFMVAASLGENPQEAGIARAQSRCIKIC